MSFPNWLRRHLRPTPDDPGRTPAPAPSPQARRPAPATPPPQTLTVELADLAAAWRAAERLLALPAPAALDPSRPVEVCITSRASGLDVRVSGAAVALRAGPLPGSTTAEIDPGDAGAVLFERLLGRACVRTAPIVAREPRQQVALPVIVTSEWGQHFMETTTASQGGCALAWSGPPPRLHARVQLRLGAGRRTATFRGAIRWVHRSPRGLQVGIRFLAGDDTAWAALLAELRAEASAA